MICVDGVVLQEQLSLVLLFCQGPLLCCLTGSIKMKERAAFYHPELKLVFLLYLSEGGDITMYMQYAHVRTEKLELKQELLLPEHQNSGRLRESVAVT